MKCPVKGINIETWKDVEGWEGYQVSDQGRARSFRNKHGGLKSTSRPLKVVISNSQPRITFCINKRLKRVSLAHVILETFVEKRPEGLVCRHLDGNIRNNNMDNLCWGTHKENIHDNIRLGVWPHGESNGNSKLTDNKVKEIRELLRTGISQRKLAALFGVSRRTIQLISRERIWKHV